MKTDDDCVTAYMPLFYGDYKLDTGDLDCLEHGAYLQLLAELWNAGGHLPFEPDRLAKRINLTRQKWDGVWSTISRFFDVLLIEGEPPRLSQKRLLHELQRAREMRRRRSDAGRKAGIASSAARSTVVGRTLDERTNDSPTFVNHPPSPSPSETDQIPPKAPPRGGDGGGGKAKLRAEPDYPADFERLWAGCDRQGSKLVAFDAWKEVARPSAEDVAASWAKWKAIAWPDGRGVPHVSTWLRAFNFRHEPAPRPVTGVRLPPAIPKPYHRPVELPPVDRGRIHESWNEAPKVAK